MVFASLHGLPPGVRESNETFENAFQWGDPLQQNMYRGMQIKVDENATDVANPAGSTPNTSVSAISQAAAAVITVASHDYKVGDRIYIDQVQGMVEINTLIANLTAVTATTLTTDIASTGFTAYTSGGRLTKVTNNQSLRPGLLIAYDRTTESWWPWASGGSDGRETIRGMLYVEQEMALGSGSAARWRANNVWGGPVMASRIIIPGRAYPGIVGDSLEATVRTQLGTQWILDDYYQQT